jgi:hypothetical protein
MVQVGELDESSVAEENFDSTSQCEETDEIEVSET